LKKEQVQSLPKQGIEVAILHVYRVTSVLDKAIVKSFKYPMIAIQERVFCENSQDKTAPLKLCPKLP
jgi:hypothetical protein